MEGIVFDIQRFALHDGPGIRTTVFLKGCPLRCLWCHNPESQAFEPQISFQPELCEDTLECRDACASPAHVTSAGHHLYDHAHAGSCGPCVDACTSGALSWVGKSMTVADVMATVERDKRYYQRTGGGLTLSGGEPLAQPFFALALLKAARRAGIHTCVDTSGHVANRHMRSAAAVTDVFLFDYKATNPQIHRALTGTDNKLILENLALLDSVGAHIILRCPLVPGLNDTPDHLRAIAEISNRFSSIKAVDILPYHSLGREKATRFGMPIQLPDQADASASDIERWHSRLQDLGCEKLSHAT
jgi:glycyl-radical enzyme activating protein